MSGTVLVLVSDADDAKHGEISVMESPGKAARLVETLLEAGFEQERIRIFNGAEMEMQVSHRPVVALVGDDAPGESGGSDDEASSPAATPEEPGEPEGVAQTASAELEEAAATPFVKDGVRFSTLFRPA